VAERKGKVRGREVEFGRCPMCGAETTEPYVTGGETNICPPEDVGGCGEIGRGHG